MQINLHPILVHFPIALLTLYAILELIRIKRIQSLPYWFYLKAILAIVGSVGAVITIQSGEMIQNEFADVGKVLQVHALWANIATDVFLVIGCAYAVAWLNQIPTVNSWLLTKPVLKPLWAALSKLSRVLTQTWLAFFIALFGLVAITITGALGGAIVHGKNIDPIVAFIYKLLVK